MTTTDPGVDSFAVAREIGEFKQRLAANAEAMADDDPLMMPVTLAVSLLTLAEGAVTLRQALPGAFLAMICGRLIDRHAALSPGDAVALAARMMVGEAQREVMLNLAEAAIDDYLAIRVDDSGDPEPVDEGKDQPSSALANQPVTPRFDPASMVGFRTKRRNLLEEGDIIELREGHTVYAMAPAKSVYQNSDSDDLCRHAVTIGGDFSYLEGRYIVYKTTQDGGSSDVRGDSYPDGHHVFCERADDPATKVDFYQSGFFTAMVHVSPVAKAKRRWELRPDDAEPGEAIGGFEPPHGDEVELDLAMINAAEVATE